MSNSDKTNTKKTADQLAKTLTPIATAIEETIIDCDRLAPQLDSRMTVSRLARESGKILRKTSLFLRGASLVTADEKSGETTPMDSTRFVSWAEQFITFGQFSGSEENKQFAARSISTELASKILAADSFRRELRPLNGVHDVSLPTWENEEKTKIRLLPPGYDESTGIFTAPAFEFPTDISPDKAYNFFLETYGDFPFSEDTPIAENRSFAVQMAAHFTAFCRLLLTDTLRPGFVFLANQSGSGKTLLARLALAPVFGPVSVEGFPKSEEERGKQLTTLVAEARPYAFFDNVKGFLSSAELEGFLTTPQRTGRILGQSATVTAPNTAAIFISGNQLTLSADLKRRVLVCDLFCSKEATDREFQSPITDTWPSRKETRSQFLGALWSLLNHWQEQDCPRLQGKLIPSFETFSEIIGGIVTTANFANPLEAPTTQMDETDEAWKMLLRALADSVADESTKEYTSDEAMQKAEELALLDMLTEGGKDTRKTFGQRIRKWKDREFADNSGRNFIFGNGRKRNSAGSLYPVTMLPRKPQ